MVIYKVLVNMHEVTVQRVPVAASNLSKSPAEPMTTISSRSISAIVSFVAIAIVAGCGNADFDAVKSYKVFLEGAKPSLQAMNRVREELFQVASTDEMLAKFRDELLPQVEKLEKLAKDQEDPEVKKLETIHTTLRSVLSRYAEATQTLVDELEKAKKDEDREKALVDWGQEDEKFGSSMQSLVRDLEAYLDKLKKR